MFRLNWLSRVKWMKWNKLPLFRSYIIILQSTFVSHLAVKTFIEAQMCVLLWKIETVLKSFCTFALSFYAFISVVLLLEFSRIYWIWWGWSTSWIQSATWPWAFAFCQAPVQVHFSISFIYHLIISLKHVYSIWQLVWFLCLWDRDNLPLSFPQKEIHP